MTDTPCPGPVPGNYQHAATYGGPISQRMWHLRKHDVLKAHLAGRCYARICDAGCGSGVIAKLVSELCPSAEVDAYDINPESIRFARQTYGGEPRLCYEVRDLLQPDASPGGSFDFIYSMEVIEHFTERDVARFLATLSSMGNEETRYLITTPDYHSLWPLIEWLLDRSSLAPTLAGHQHLTRFTKRRLVRMVERQGFRVLDIYRFCGLSPFLAHVSRALSDTLHRWERRWRVGNLLCCEMEKA